MLFPYSIKQTGDDAKSIERAKKELVRLDQQLQVRMVFYLCSCSSGTGGKYMYMFVEGKSFKLSALCAYIGLWIDCQLSILSKTMP